MIQNLNSLSFFKYGKVYMSDFKEVCRLESIEITDVKQLNLTAKSFKSMICTTNSVSVLGLMEGLAVLYVSENPSAGSIEAFLLDKTISLNKGIYFNVVPLYGVCSIKLGKLNNGEVNEYFLPDEFTLIGIEPRFSINSVYTLFYQDKDPNFLFKGEKHNFWELTYVDKGLLYNNVDGKDYVLKQGDLIFYKENQYHIQWTDEKTPASFITITFDMDFDDSSLLSNRIFSVDEKLKAILKNIISESQEGLYYSNDIIICYLKVLIIKFIRRDKIENTIYSLQAEVKDKVENSIIAQVLDYIHNNIEKKFNISDIASHVHLSQSYLSTIFKQNMDTTIIEYINKYRLEKGKLLIRSLQYSITQVSELLGYASIHYFSRQFKAHFGMSPTAYADSIKEQKSIKNRDSADTQSL